jgi:hypothetical protein
MDTLTDQEVQQLIDSMQYKAVIIMGVISDILDNLVEFETTLNLN